MSSAPTDDTRSGLRSGHHGTRSEEGAQVLTAGPLAWSVHVDPADPSHPPDAQVRRVDDVVAIRWTAPPFRAARGLHHICGDEHAYVVVDVVDRGRLRVRQSDLDVVVADGGAVAWDSDRPVRVSASEPSTGRRLVVPRHVLTDVGCSLSMRRPTGPLAATTVLRGYLAVLDAAPTGPSGPAAVAARNALLELVWGALQPDLPLDPLALLPSRRAAVDHYLDTHLGVSGLSVEQVAAAHCISSRSLARLFQATGETFGGVLAAKRLARVREGLRTRDTTVESLARRWGFTDASHLNRRFRASFGVSPGEYRAVSADRSSSGHSNGPGGALVHSDGRHVPDRRDPVPGRSQV